MSKECTKCGETKPLDQMVRNARRSDGHDSECKECKRERSKRYYRQEPEKKRAYYLANYERISERESKRRKENPEKRRAYNLEYRRKNGDKIREKNREWRENNKAYIYEKNRVYRQETREHIQAWQRDHYEKNKERIRAMEKVRIEAWKKANPEKAARAAAERTARYNNHKKNVVSDGHTTIELHDHWEATGRNPKVCTYCDGPIPNWYSSVGDHILPVSTGGSDTVENLAPCCQPCNASKCDRLLHVEWTPPNMRLRNVS